MVVNVINLPKREDRRASAEKQAIQQGFEPKFWDGIFDKHYPMRGICKAHKQIIEHAKCNHLPSVTIMEDDCIFSAPKAFDYFISKTPDDYHLWMGLIYVGQIEDGRVVEGFSGGMTLYTAHESFYDFLLQIPEKAHIDVYCGQFASTHKYYVSDPMVCTQMGGYSDNLKMTLYYDAYLKGIKLFGR